MFIKFHVYVVCVSDSVCVYICMYVYICVYVCMSACVHIHIQTHMHNTHADRLHTYISVCICDSNTYRYTHRHTHTDIPTYTHMCGLLCSHFKITHTVCNVPQDITSAY